MADMLQGPELIDFESMYSVKLGKPLMVAVGIIVMYLVLFPIFDAMSALISPFFGLGRIFRRKKQSSCLINEEKKQY